MRAATLLEPIEVEQPAIITRIALRQRGRIISQAGVVGVGCAEQQREVAAKGAGQRLRPDRSAAQPEGKFVLAIRQRVPTQLADAARSIIGSPMQHIALNELRSAPYPDMLNLVAS